MLALSLVAVLQASSPPPVTIANPDWAQIPNARDMSRHYPKRAFAEHLAGRATLMCTVSAQGRLTDCTTEQVAPQNAGFGEAALAVAATFQMRPMTRDGKPVAGGQIRIPIRFLVPANLRATPVRTMHPDIKGETVELDCRFRDSHLDNCLTRGATDTRAGEIAAQLAETVTLPPTPRREGRIILPLIFEGAAGAIAAPDHVMTPRWVARPTASDVFRAYPQPARATRTRGYAVVECSISAGGALDDCSTVAEAPIGHGFGAGTQALMPLFRVAPLDSFGMKVEGRKIRVPVQFSPAPRSRRGTG